jgi:hypothetical protein
MAPTAINIQLGKVVLFIFKKLFFIKTPQGGAKDAAFAQV